MLEDIAILTGGTVISEERGFKMENTTIDMLGTCEKVEIDKDNTTLVNGAGSKEDILARTNQIKAQIETTTSDYDKEKLTGKISKTCWWCSSSICWRCYGSRNEREER